jgi:hypothetical protein
MYIRNLLLFISFLFSISCSGPSSKIIELQEDVFNEKQSILCPKVSFIEGLDKLIVNVEEKETYKIKFHEVKWICYSKISEDRNQSDNIDLSISFKVDYIDVINDFKAEKFTFIVALLNKNNEIISKNKFSRSFLNNSKSEIISNNDALINIKVNNSNDTIYDHRLLLGFIKN